MKNAIFKSALFVLLTIVLVGTNSCKKYNPQPADRISGSYIGSGTDVNGLSYSNVKVQITRISDKRVRVEPVGHSYISTFEINVEEVLDKVISFDDSSYQLAAQFQGNEVDLGIEGVQEEFFGGKRQ